MRSSVNRSEEQTVIVEVQSGAASRVLRLLKSCGARACQNLGMGYLWAIVPCEQLGEVQKWRGVRAVLPAAESPTALLTSEPAHPPIAVDAFVKLSRERMGVVGQVVRVSGSEATVVFSLLGRPIEQVCPLSELELLEAPEVWR